MMYGSRPPTNPARELARHRMELVPNIHVMHLAIVMGKDEIQLLEFEEVDRDRMFDRTIPTFVHETGAVGVIVSSPAPGDRSDGAIVALMERTLETFYVPIVRSTNADILIGDFRSITVTNVNPYGPILEALIANWIERDKT